MFFVIHCVRQRQVFSFSAVYLFHLRPHYFSIRQRHCQCAVAFVFLPHHCKLHSATCQFPQCGFPEVKSINLQVSTATPCGTGFKFRSLQLVKWNCVSVMSSRRNRRRGNCVWASLFLFPCVTSEIVLSHHTGLWLCWNHTSAPWFPLRMFLSSLWKCSNKNILMEKN